METAALIAGGFLSVSFLVAVYLWNKRSYRAVPKTEETDAHRVEQNETITHYEKKRDKLSKLKEINDSEVVDNSNSINWVMSIMGFILTFFVGYNVYTAMMSTLGDVCGGNSVFNTTGYSPVVDSSSCGLISNATGMLPIVMIGAILITIFNIMFAFIKE